MIELNISTKRGKEVYKMGMQCQNHTLYNLYKKPSSPKINAYKKCCEEFCKTNSPFDFGVGNANSFGFTAKWYGRENDDVFMRVETKDNSYKVWLTR